MRTIDHHDSQFFKHTTCDSEGIPVELQEFIQLYESVRAIPLPPSLQKPIKRRGRKSYNRFLLVSLLLYGVLNRWSYREIEEFAKKNWDVLQNLSFGVNNAPDHSLLYITATRMKLSDFFRYLAKWKKLRGDIPVLWY